MLLASEIKTTISAGKKGSKALASLPIAAASKTAKLEGKRIHRENTGGTFVKYLLMCFMVVSIFSIYLFPTDVHAWDPNNNGYWNNNNNWQTNTWNNGYGNNNDWNNYNNWSNRWNNNIQSYRDNYGSYQWKVRGALPYKYY